MRKPINLISGGLMGLVVGASGLLNGCEEPQGNYNDNQQQRNDAGQAGLDLLQFTLGLYGVAGDGTSQQRNAAGFTSNLIGKEKRDEAIRKSGTTVNVYNGQPQRQQQDYVPRPTSQIEKVWVDYDSFDENGNKVMNIHTKFQVENKIGKNIKLFAYFYNKNGENLRDSDSLYYCGDNQVCAKGRILCPVHQIASYADEIISIPYKQLEIRESGKHILKFNVVIWDFSEETPKHLASSDFLDFYMINQ